MLALITASGMLPGTMMPVIVTVAHGGLGFTPRDAGLLAGVDVGAAACGALLMAIIGVPDRWRRPAAAAIAGTILFDLASTAVSGFSALLALRALRGLIGGVLMGMGYAAIGRQAARDRLFGLLLVVQFLVGAAGIALLPALVIATGAWLLFLIFAGCGALMLALLPLTPEPAPVAPAADGAVSRVATWPVLSALGVLFLFEASHTAISGFIIELGRTRGLGLVVAQHAAGLGAAGGALGAFVVIALGTRYGRTGPILIATLFGLVSGGLLLLGSEAAFVGGAAIGAIAWGGSIPYVLALCTMGSRRGAAWASFVAKLGLAAGPVLSGLLVRPGAFTPAVWLGCALSLAGALLLIAGARRDATVPAR